MQRLSGQTKMLWCSVPQYSFAVMSLKALKNRMRSVSSIKKITKAMKMVAASKMRQDVARLDQGKQYGVSSVQDMLASESYLQKRKPQVKIQKTLLVPFSSDKGLCGGVNTQIVRACRTAIKQDPSAYKLFLIGEKAQGGLARHFPSLLTQSCASLYTPTNFALASSLTQHIQENVTDDTDQIVLVYNEFKNIITQYVRQIEVPTKKHFLKEFKYVTKYETAEPDKEFLAHFLYEYYLATQVYHALLNNNASETSSRMNAMENASKNAGEMLNKLTLEYNKARQAKITMELCEIISGAASV